MPSVPLSYDLPEEMNLLRETVRKFVDKELIPVETQTLDGGKLRPEFREKFEARMRDLGLWRMNIPVEYGGLGLGVLADTIVEEELSRTVALPQRGPKITGPEIRPTLYNLTGEMRERYLMPCITGEKKACFGQTEPDAGSDPGSMRTTAVRDGDEYVINGVKHFINNADEADFIVLLAATDRKKGSHGGISAFIVDVDTPGVSLPTNYPIITGERLWKIQFDNVRVPASHLVLGEGQGFKLGQQALGLGRINQAARAVGVTERCLELATSYAKQRVTFGAPLSDRQSIQWMLVDPFVELHMARMALYDAAKKADEGQDVRVQAYMVKLFCCELAYRTAERCLHIHGATGLVSEMPTSALWHAARTYLIGEGTPEVMRMVLARKMFEYYT